MNPEGVHGQPLGLPDYFRYFYIRRRLASNVSTAVSLFDRLTQTF